MAIIKHIPVKNRYYSAAVEYLSCKFDEHTMKPLEDAKGRMIMRDNFLIEGINCKVDTFGAECIEVNRYYGKNNAAKDVKAHHYIISFAPEDNITMQEAMEFGKQYAEKFLPGHQTILAVHPDGHNGTGNVHVHIVINSVRKYEGKKERWQDKPCEYRQGCKHKSTGKFMHAAKRWVMRECMVKGYNQVNLLARSDGNNYWVEKRGKEAIRNEQERMRLAESEWRQSEKLAQHEEEHTTRTDASVLKEPVDEFEEALNNEYDMTFATKLEQATVTSPDMDVISEAMDIRAKLICLEYEQEYNLNKISDLDYEIRHHNPNYQSYVENQALIRKKQSYINQWTQELGQCKLFQRDLKKYYKEQIQEAESEISDIKEANTKILAKAGCRNEDELRCYQDSYQQKKKQCDILAQRNQSIKKECAALKESYINLISQADESTREKFITDKKEYQKSSAAKAEAILRGMYAEAYSEMDAQTAMIRVETSLQNVVGDGRFHNGIIRTKGSR